MKIFTANQLKALDAYTIAHEPVTSVHLMERAGNAIFKAINQRFPNVISYVVCCGCGNNGGDGLVIAQLLKEAGSKVLVVVLKGKGTPEFLYEFEKVKALQIRCIEIENQAQISLLQFDANTFIIDAIFGIGISRPAEGLEAALIATLNNVTNPKLAIDLPSGMSPDALFESDENNTIKAQHTFTIQLPKLAFYFASNRVFTGMIEVIDIGLAAEFVLQQETPNRAITEAEIHALIKPRATGAHKNDFGHALLLAGSEGKFGAAILAASSAMRSGCGLLTVGLTDTGISALLCHLPEAMTFNRDKVPDYNEIKLEKYQAIGIGPGLGTDNMMVSLLEHLMKNYKETMVIDADGLNMLAANRHLYSHLTRNMVLTPHPGEFDRLTKKHTNDLERFKTLLDFAKSHNVTVLLKGHFTTIASADGLVYFNTTGNSGMATAGSGDVLTGIITALAAQGYNAANAAVLGAYLHGYAGDLAAAQFSKTSLIASDIIRALPATFKVFEK